MLILQRECHVLITFCKNPIYQESLETNVTKYKEEIRNTNTSEGTLQSAGGQHIFDRVYVSKAGAIPLDSLLLDT